MTEWRVRNAGAQRRCVRLHVLAGRCLTTTYRRYRPTPAIRIAGKQTFNEEFQTAPRDRCARKLALRWRLAYKITK